MLIIRSHEVREILAGREVHISRIVRDAYVRHWRGQTSLPHSVFLRFPEDARNRIIALPAHLGGDHPVTGVKWVSSFPGNVQAGTARATAAIVLNSTTTGHPEALIEGALISASRTAASAALAATTLGADLSVDGVTLVGCGVINFAVLRFLRVALPNLSDVTVFDTDVARAHDFAARCEPRARVAVGIADALAAHSLVSVATTATTPHLDVGACKPGTLVLHLSLRDFTAAAILAADNIVDDVDHVCRAATSLDLAQAETGGRDFIEATLGQILDSGAEYRANPDRMTLFSPFGLGILDIAVADFVRERALAAGLGVKVPDFLPEKEI